MIQPERFPRGAQPAPTTLLRVVGVLLLSLGLTTCGEQTSGPSSTPSLGVISASPVWLGGGEFVGANLPIDHLHAVVVRPTDPTPPIKDTTVVFDANQVQLNLSLPLILLAPAESLDVTLELLSGTQVLFSGTERIEAHSGPPSNTPPPSIPLTYQGPGTQLTTLVLDPPDSTVMQGDSLPMRVSGFDAQAQAVTAFYVTWSSTDTTVARVNGNGVVSGRVSRGQVYIRARTPATAQFPQGVVDSTTVMLVPVPSTVTIISGDNQAGTPGQPLALPFVLQVKASDNLGVPGIPVTFTAPAGGSVLPAVTMTDASGFAQALGTLPANASGTVPFTVQAGSFAGITFNATTTALTPTWTGAVSTDWSTGGNWNTGQVPLATDSVAIPAAANAPSLSANVSAGAVNVAGGTLTLAGHTLSVTRTFATRGSGTVVMTNPADQLTVSGNAIFDGGNELNFMSAGTLTVVGNLTQLATNSPDAFHPSGSHKTVLAGTAPTVSFATPGIVPGSSHFQELQWNGGGVLTLASNVFAHGAFTGNPNIAGTIAGTGQALQVGALSSGGMTFNNVRLVLDQPAGLPLALDNVSFINESPTVVQLQVNHPGAAAAFTFDNLSFGTTPTSGFYLGATDLNPSDGQVLTLEISNSTPATPGNFVQTAGGAVVDWPAVIPGPPTWTGAVSTDWNTGGNWTTGQVPIATDDVTIPSTANQPVVGQAAQVRNLTVQAGATVTIGAGIILTTNGDLGLSGVITGNNGNLTVVGNITTLAGSTLSTAVLTVGGTLSVAGTYGVLNNTLFNGTGQVIPANLAYTNLSVSGTASLAGRTTASNSVLVFGAGSLTLAGHTLVAGPVQVGQAPGDVATLTMTNALDSIVATNVSFLGGSTAGKLTAGVIVMTGNFTETSLNSSQAFAPSGSHLVVFAGGGIQTVSFGSSGPGQSALQNVGIVNTAGQLSLGSDVRVLGQSAFDPLVPHIVLGGGHTITFQITNVDGVTFDNALVNLANAPFTAFDNNTFQNYAPTATVLTVNDPGAAAAYTLNNLVFSVTPTTGFYINAIDNTADANTLTLDLVNPTPAASGGFVQTSGGAVVNWPAATGTITWTGSVSSDWSDPGNWSPAQVPTVNDDVLILPATSGPMITLTGAAKNLTIDGPGASLNINGLSLGISGNLSVLNGGLLIMQTPNDFFSVGGDALFDGGNELGSMSGGILNIGGNLTQNANSSPDSFHPSGTMLTRLAGQNPTASFATPGIVPGSSHFEDVQWLGSGTLTLGSNAFAHGTFTGNGTVTGTARSLQVGNVSASSGLTFDNVRLVVDQAAGLPITVSNLTFSNQDPTAVQLQVNHPGIGSPFGFTNLTFSTVPTSGFYLVANDLNPSDGQVLAIDMVNPNPGTDGGFSQGQNGAVITWPAAGVVWNGSVSTDWFTAGNWSTNQVPATSDNVLIPSGRSNYPVLTANVLIHNFTGQSGATFDLGGHVLTVSDYDMAGTPVGTGTVLLGAFTGNAQGTAPTLQVANGAAYSVGPTQSLVVLGNLIVNGGLALGSAAPSVQVFGNLSVVGVQAGLDMHLGGVVIVQGSALFDGMNSTPFFTNGTLAVGGDFTVMQSNSPLAFAASGSNAVTLSNAQQLPTTVSMQSPGLANNRFATLALSGLTSIVLATPTYVADVFVANSSTVTGGGNLLSAGFPQINGLTLDNTPFTISNSTMPGLALDNVTFQNMSPTATQLTVDLPGGASSLAFNNLTFNTVPTTGFYLSATDNLADANVLTIDMNNPTPTTDGGFVQTAGGAVVNWPAAAGVVTWTGAVSTDWSVAANWSTNQVPTASDDVLIPSGTPNQAGLTGTAMVHNLDVQTGAILSIGAFNLQVFGDISISGQVVGPVGTGGTVFLEGASRTAAGNFDAFVAVAGSYQLSGNLVIRSAPTPDSLVVVGSLQLNGHTATAGAFGTSANGLLLMNQPLDSLVVAGNVVFQGGNESGLLSDGTILIGGDFFQFGSFSALSFAPSGSHVTVFNGTGTQVIDFQTPGIAQSRFQNLAVANTAGGVTLATDVTVAGQAVFAPVVPRIIHGNGPTVTLDNPGATNISNLTFDNVLLTVSGGTITSYDNLTFQNYAPTATALSILHPGATTPFTLSNMVFAVTPTTGFYLSANDTDGPVPDVLTLDMVNPNPGASGGFVQTVGGAVINWPATAGVATWTGAVSTDWSNPGNWSSGLVPSSNDSVQIGAATNQPVLTATSVVGAVEIISGGNLRPNGQTMAVARSFSTSGTGLVTMTGASDGLSVGGDAVFDGGDETGLLTDGVLVVGGNFKVLNSQSNAAFAASGAHNTVLSGNGPQALSVAVPGTSHFQGLVLQNSGPGVTLQTPVVATGDLIAVLSGGLVLGGGNSITAGGITASGTIFDNVPLLLGDGTLTLIGVSFQNYAATATQVSISNSGVAGPFTFTDVSFLTTPTPGGFYLTADDINTGDGQPLTIDMVNPTPADPGTFLQTTNGAIVNWAGGGAPTWTGTSNGDWNNPANWSGNQVPAAGSDVHIPAGTPNSPGLTGDISVNNLTIDPGANLDNPDFIADVSGDFTGGGSTTGTPITMSGAGATLSANPNSLLITGQVSLGAPVVAASDVSVSGAGASLTLGGFQLTTGILYVSSDGVVVMTNPADALIATGVAQFDGGDETGRLTDGLLSVAGDFSQAASTSSTSFAASGNLLTVLGSGPSPSTVTFASPGSSVFANLEIVGTQAVTLGSDAVAENVLVGNSGGFGLGGHLLTANQTFATTSGGLLEMNSANDILTVKGSTLFDGGDETGHLTAGTLHAEGDFIQFNTTSHSSFVAGSGHTVVLDGSAPQTVTMTDSLNAPFGNLTISNTFSVNVQSLTRVTGNLDITSGAIDATNPASLFPGFEVFGDVTSAPGSSLDASRVFVGGTISIGGSYTVTSTVFTGSGQTVPTSVPYQDLWIYGTATAAAGNLTINNLEVAQPGASFALSGITQVNGNVTLGRFGGGDLKVNNHKISLLGSLNTLSAGTLTMQSLGDSVLVTGAASFGGGDETGRLTNGVLSVGGSFTQTSGSSPSSFAASGNHFTKVGSAAVRVMNLASPGIGAGTSHFQDLDVTAATGGLTLNSNLVVNGTLFSQPGGGTAPTLTGGGKTVTAVALSVNKLILDNAPMILDEQGTVRAQQFDNVIFQNFPTVANTTILMNMTMVGSALATRSFTINTPTVQTSLGSGGLYAQLMSSNGFGITVTIAGSNDPTGGPSRSNPPFGNTVNGARIVWQ